MDFAIKYGVKKVVFISTDKSVNPISVMGTTKLLAEKQVINASTLTHKPIFSVVRFGNVLGSRGSVIMIFERQVKEGGPITVTDPEMTRFIMLSSDAAKLVLRAAELANPGEIFVLKMNAVNIGDLAKASRDFFGKLYHKDISEIEIVNIGANPGEKMHEELMTIGEATNVVENEEYFIVNPHPERLKGTSKRVQNKTEYSSNSTPLISIEEIISLLSQLVDD